MDWDFGDILLTMFAFFFWVSFILIFVSAFADIFRRTDLSGWAKAGWALLICVLPLFGCLIYMIARPPVVPTDVVDIREAGAPGYGTAYSPADEIAKLSQLHDDGKLSAAEFEQLKVKAIA